MYEEHTEHNDEYDQCGRGVMQSCSDTQKVAIHEPIIQILYQNCNTNIALFKQIVIKMDPCFGFSRKFIISKLLMLNKGLLHMLRSVLWGSASVPIKYRLQIEHWV